MTTVTLPSSVYYGFIERWTTPTDRLICIDRSEQLPGGMVRFELIPAAKELLDNFRLEGETYAECFERLFALGLTGGLQ